MKTKIINYAILIAVIAAVFISGWSLSLKYGQKRPIVSYPKDNIAQFEHVLWDNHPLVYPTGSKYWFEIEVENDNTRN